MNESLIFAAALKKKTEAEREAYLEGACGNNAELRKQIAELLRLHQQEKSFLEQPVARFEATVDMPAGKWIDPDTLKFEPDDKPGTLIGPYKLLQKIGEGGMGTVWMAEQQEPVRRMIAIKLVKAGMDSAKVVARFEAERQALALMDHPNIARIYDAGIVGQRPYFVMELVKGTSITKYCDEHRLQPRQRLELFVAVCQAIQHAHQKGIIHRDIKPSNVLVAPYDGHPVVKVIDFGVAKATGQRLTDKTMYTEFGAVIGTVEYMSPEQAELNNQDIDTRSDIYSLGVLLYELLTGSTPLNRKNFKEQAILEMLRIVREQEPPKPSTRLSTDVALPSISAQRKTDPAKLTRLMRGDLDWIAMKSLEKDRNRRYETANSFGMDIQRYLGGQAVMACPPSTTYRLKKFLNRNKTSVIAASMISLALFSGIILSIIGYTRTQARAYAERLLESPTSELPKLLLDLKPLWADSILKQAADGEDPRRKLNASLALLSRDESMKRYIADRLPEAAPAEVSVFVEALKPYVDTVPKIPNNLRVAALEAANGKVEAHKIAEMLVAENSFHFAPWLEAFRPVAKDLQPALAAIYRDSKRRESQRTQAVNFLSEYAKDDPTFVADLILDADEAAFVTLYPVLAKHTSKAIDALQAELAKKTDDKTPEAERDRLASRQAIAAISLIRLGKANEVWSLLKFSPDPTVRSWIIHRLKPYGVDFNLIHSQFKTEADISAKRALVLILGEYGLGELV
ncbi:serine/threonine protein kinase [Telmatocola sphagniphila]|uniref:Serine/threonine protein kinase n=1 Tax=Telmatocola sphagniphila TaxID=1123043 RepID=A0A8E6EUR9_9BACT|nr:serine/threonine-protein kinase [Telmatocola sphagniphila]QVL34024.1 serine/threonine protein kinase [Telmatocola sphagniphila]